MRNITDKFNKNWNIFDKCLVKSCIIFQEIPVEEEGRIPFLNEQIISLFNCTNYLNCIYVHKIKK